MGLLGLVTTRYRMSQAAVVIQKLLELQARQGFLEGNPASLANELVHKVWTHRPDVFDGTYGHRPHKLASAALALANGLVVHRDNYFLKNSLLISLAEILKEVDINRRAYVFSSLDTQLLEVSLKEFFKENERMSSDGSLLSSLGPMA